MAKSLLRRTTTMKKCAVFPMVICGLGMSDTDNPALGDDYIYCHASNEPHSDSGWYYTAIFKGDYSYTVPYEKDFGDFLEDNEPETILRYISCSYEKTQDKAEFELRYSQEQLELRGRRVVSTNWAPTGGGQSDSRSFSERAIRDFEIWVPDSPYDVQVCVRDHECEDGDRVRVSVDGKELLAGEIIREWNCRGVRLREGRHDIELYAVNGTGYKGNCSYADGNTGEIRVTGGHSQTQSWRHRGGEGSSANIVVTVR